MTSSRSRLRRSVPAGLMAIASMAVACSGGGAASGDDAMGSEAEIKEGKLSVTSQAKLPADEISGLGRRTASGKTQYLAIPDAETALLTFDVDAAGRPSQIAKHDLSGLFASGPSQWEAVAGDGSGAVFVLAEASDTIHVLDAGLKRVVHTIQLVLPKHHPLEDAWKDDLNSHGEGMLLLANGHVLVVKEKSPVALIEFAVDGEAAQGYRPALALGAGDTFAVPPGSSSTMTAVHHWLLKSSDVKLVADVSELALDVDGRLLLLSDQRRAVVRVEQELRADEDKIDVKTVLVLPSAVEKPEGLVLASGVPLVAIDRKNGGDNLFTLKPLP